jgi:UDP-N-acetylmuramoyl-L-alanyl-D-glutamate--2,6-diaminopimelate ligase
MGAAAAGEAAVVIVTDDNPRTEAPESIRAEVLAGARAVGTGAEVIDGGPRRDAIRLALQMARSHDAIAVLGKGHETGQDIGGEILPFNDADVIREEWQRLQEGR